MLVHRRVTPSIEFAGTHLYTWVERSTVRVKCFAQEHNTMSPARPRTRTTRSGVERTNHEATAPPTHIVAYSPYMAVPSPFSRPRARHKQLVTRQVSILVRSSFSRKGLVSPFHHVVCPPFALVASFSFYRQSLPGEWFLAMPWARPMLTCGVSY